MEVSKLAQSKKRRFYMRTAILAVLVVAIVFTVYSNLNKEKNAVLQVGDKAPDFVLVDMDGTERRLSDYKGQGVFLNFWGTWCKPCAKEMPPWTTNTVNMLIRVSKHWLLILVNQTLR